MKSMAIESPSWAIECGVFGEMWAFTSKPSPFNFFQLQLYLGKAPLGQRRHV
jgi:hypothetical protein